MKYILAISSLLLPYTVNASCVPVISEPVNQLVSTTAHESDANNNLSGSKNISLETEKEITDALIKALRKKALFMHLLIMTKFSKFIMMDVLNFVTYLLVRLLI